MNRITIDEFIARLGIASAALEELPAQAIAVQGQELLGMLLQRIFNKGLAADGKQIGQYINERYKAAREADGFQVDYVDLQRTGRLFESLNIGSRGTSLVIGFTDANRAAIAGYLEERYERPIFELSEAEIQEAITVVADYIGFRITEILINGLRVT